MKKITLLLLAGVLILSTLGAGCTSKRHTAENPHVKVALGSSLSIFMDVAKVYGTYNESGIIIDNVLITDSHPELLIKKDVDFQLAQTVPYLRAISSGAPLKLVGEISNKNPIMLVIRKEKKDEIKSISGLKGKRILLLPPGTSPYKMAVQSIKKAGLKPNNDVTLITVGKPSPQVVLSMFKKGEVDAAFLPPHLTAPIIAKGIGLIVNTPSKPVLNAGIFVRAKECTEKKNVVGAFVDGSNKTLKVFKEQNTKEIAKKLLKNSETKEHYVGYDEDSLTAYVEVMREILSDSVAISEKDFENMVSFAESVLGGNVTFSEACDTSFAGKK